MANINNEVLQEFKPILLLVDWDSVTILRNSKVACNRVFFFGLYDMAFPEQNILEIERISRVFQKKTKTILNCSAKETKSMQKDTRYIKHYSKH